MTIVPLINSCLFEEGCCTNHFQHSYPIVDWCCHGNRKGQARATNLSFKKVTSWQGINLENHVCSGTVFIAQMCHKYLAIECSEHAQSCTEAICDREASKLVILGSFHPPPTCYCNSIYTPSSLSVHTIRSINLTK